MTAASARTCTRAGEVVRRAAAPLLVAALVAAARVAPAQTPSPTPTPYRSNSLDAAHGGRESLLLWRDGAPGALGTAPEDRPKLALYRAPAAAANGTGVVVCPGGGYHNLA